MCRYQQTSRINNCFHITFRRTIYTNTIEVGHDSTVDPAHERAERINIMRAILGQLQLLIIITSIV